MGGFEWLRRRADYRRVFDDGQAYPSRFVVLYVIWEQDGASRIGVTTARKLGTAVLRNRVKRRLREIVRHLSGSVKPGFSAVIVARAGSGAAAYQELERDIRRVFQRAGLLLETG